MSLSRKTVPLSFVGPAPLLELSIVLPVLVIMSVRLSLRNVVECASCFVRFRGSMRAQLLGITGAVGWRRVLLDRNRFGVMAGRFSPDTA